MKKIKLTFVNYVLMALVFVGVCAFNLTSSNASNNTSQANLSTLKVATQSSNSCPMMYVGMTFCEGNTLVYHTGGLSVCSTCGLLHDKDYVEETEYQGIQADCHIAQWDQNNCQYYDPGYCLPF